MKNEKEYSDFTTDDFIADEYFQRWVKCPDIEITNFWKAWLNSHPHKIAEVNKACAFINHLSFTSQTPDDQKVEASLQRSLAMIAAIENGQSTAPVKRMGAKYWLAVAAVVVGAIFFATHFINQQPRFIEIATGAEQIRSFILPDQSVITLNANSSLRYSSDLDENEKREVWLKGEAFFDIKHIEKNNKSHRFLVHTDDLQVEVLGTTFNVKKRNDVYNVSLNTGSIKIKMNDQEGSSILLSSGDFFQYAAKEKNMVKKKVKPELYSTWKDQKMTLDKTPLLEIAGLIHDIYGYETIIEDSALNDEAVSGTIMLGNEVDLIQALSYALNIDIIKNDSTLLFQSKIKTK